MVRALLDVDSRASYIGGYRACLAALFVTDGDRILAWLPGDGYTGRDLPPGRPWGRSAVKATADGAAWGRREPRGGPQCRGL
jgi:hypothetical protein